MRVRLRKLLLLALAGAAPFVATRVAAQGLLAPLFGSEMEQDYETGAPQAPAKPATKPQRGRGESSKRPSHGRAAAKPHSATPLASETADQRESDGPSDAAPAEASGSSKAKPKPAIAGRAPVKPPTTPAATAAPPPEGDVETALEPPDASSPDTTGALKPKPPVKRRVLANAPLPPPRPWGDRDAPGAEPEAVAALPVTPVAPAPAPVEPTPSPAIAPPIPAPAAPVHGDDRRPKSLVVLAKSGLRNPNDLKDRRIATGLSGETPERLKEVVQEGAGLRLDPVAMSWGAGLVSLAKGEVDGVTVSLGPPLTPDETKGVAMAGFQLLEVPLDGAAGAGRR